LFNIHGKVVMITGATGGIGFAIARYFAGLGAKLALTGRSENLKMIARRIKKPEFAPLLLRADLSNEGDIEKIVRKTESEWGRIDVLINCAGVNVRKKIDEYTSEEWDRILNVNLKAVFILTNEVAAVMKKRSYGKIINVSSIQGVICWAPGGKFSLAPYCASKAALISLTKSFALALAAYNITVNAICPAVVDGKWAKNLKDDPVLYQDIISRTPLKRLAKNGDLLGPALFLATEASSYVTGHALLVDGGWTIQ